MNLPRLGTLVVGYVVLLVCIAGAASLGAYFWADVAGTLQSAAVDRPADGWAPDQAAHDHADVTTRTTRLQLSGPSPANLIGNADHSGSIYYFGPLRPGDCLFPLNVQAHELTFRFYDIEVRLGFGVDDQGVFRRKVVRRSFPAKLPAGTDHLEVCFPYGVDFEQWMLVQPRGSAQPMSVFAGTPRLVPPPFRKQPRRRQYRFDELPPRYVTIEGHSVLTIAGLDLDLSIANPAPIAIELGEYGPEHEFLVREHLEVAAGTERPLSTDWPHLRVTLPQGGRDVFFSLEPNESVS